MSIQRSAPFASLAEVYQAGGFAAYGTALADELHAMAFDLEWTGRTLLDLGSGTGDVALAFGARQFRVLGIDLSPQMLHQAEVRAVQSGYDVRFMPGDMRTFVTPFKFDMATCIGGTLNYTNSVRDIEAVFKVVQASLAPGKVFFFDLRTIEGLADSAGERVLADRDDLFIVSRSTFNFETLALTVQYTILRHGGQGWTRAEETHTLRGYPVAPLTKLLNGAGFRVVTSAAPHVYPLDARRPEDMIVFVAVRE